MKGLAKEKSDYLQAQAFLHRYKKNQATYNLYRREIERFCQWSWLVNGTALPFIKPSDIHKFVEFCQNPPSSWCGQTQGVARFMTVEGKRKPNPEWRPFSKRGSENLLSNASVTELYRALMLFFDYCAYDGYVLANPAKRAWQDVKSTFMVKNKVSLSSTLTNELLLQVLKTMTRAAEEAPHLYERTLFIINLMAGLSLKISDLVSTQDHVLTMGNFYQDGQGSWWFKTETPNWPVQNIAVSGRALKALKRYRAYLKLTPLPKPNEATPLLAKQKGSGPITDTSSIRKIVKHAFELSRQQLKKNGLDELALELQSTQASWLRNTAISSAMPIKRPEHIQQDASFRSLGSLERHQDSSQEKLVKNHNKT